MYKTVIKLIRLAHQHQFKTHLTMRVVLYCTIALMYAKPACRFGLCPVRLRSLPWLKCGGCGTYFI